MSRNTFYFWVFSLVPVFLFFLKPISVGDLSVWVALGRDTLNQMSLVKIDTYTFTNPEINFIYPVLISCLYALIYRVFSYDFLVFLHGLVPVFWIYFSYDAVKKHFNSDSIRFWNFQTIAVFALSLLGCALILIPRPALIASLFLLYSYIQISSKNKNLFDLKTLISFFLLEVIWVNVHGSFLLLPIMLGWQAFIFLADKNWSLFKNRLLAAAATSVGSLFSPFFFAVFEYTFATARISKARGLDEWFPPHRFDYPFASVLFYLTSLGLIFLLFKNFKRVKLSFFSDPFFILWLSGFFAIRNTFFLFLCLPVFLLKLDFYHFVSEKPEAPPSFSKKINFAAILILSLLILCLSPFFKPRFSNWLDKKEASVYVKYLRSDKINTYLQQNQGAIFNTWVYGSELALSQKNKYFIDTRNIIFPDEIDKEYSFILKEPQAHLDLLKKYDIRYFIIQPEEQALYKWLNSNKNCQLDLDDVSILLFKCNTTAYLP